MKRSWYRARTDQSSNNVATFAGGERGAEKSSAKKIYLTLDKVRGNLTNLRFELLFRAGTVREQSCW